MQVSIKSKLRQIQKRIETIRSHDDRYLLTESDCERFNCRPFRGHRGVMQAEYAAGMLLDGCPIEEVRQNLSLGQEVVGHRKKRPFIIVSGGYLFADRDLSASEKESAGED